MDTTMMTILARFKDLIGETRTVPARRHAPGGQAIIEFAVISMLLLTLSFGVIEFGRAYAASMAVTHASRDGARIAMNPEATNGEIAAAAQSAAGSLTLTNVNVSRSTVIGEMSTITATYEFETMLPFVASLWGGGTLTISESATSRVGWQ